MHPLHRLADISPRNASWGGDAAEQPLFSPGAASYGIMAPHSSGALTNHASSASSHSRSPSLSAQVNQLDMHPALRVYRSHSRNSSVSSLSVFNPSDGDRVERRCESSPEMFDRFQPASAEEVACIDQAAMLTLCPGERRSPIPPSTSAFTTEDLKTPHTSKHKNSNHERNGKGVVRQSRHRLNNTFPQDVSMRDSDSNDSSKDSEWQSPSRWSSAGKKRSSKKVSRTRLRATAPEEDEEEVILVTAITSSGKKSHARKRPQGHIPRPRNAFILYRKHVVDAGLIPPEVEIRHQNISVVVARMWKELGSLDPALKAKFQEQARIEKEEHVRLYPDYKYQPVYRRTDSPQGKTPNGSGKVAPPKTREKDNQSDDVDSATKDPSGPTANCTGRASPPSSPRVSPSKTPSLVPSSRSFTGESSHSNSSFLADDHSVFPQLECRDPIQQQLYLPAPQMMDGWLHHPHVDGYYPNQHHQAFAMMSYPMQGAMVPRQYYQQQSNSQFTYPDLYAAGAQISDANAVIQANEERDMAEYQQALEQAHMTGGVYWPSR